METFTPDFFKFIYSHSSENPDSLRLKFRGKESSFDTDLAITQIECRRKGASKLASFIGNDRFVFPSSLAYEQASHEAVARFHSQIAGECGNVLDMTAGLGIDAMTLASIAGNVTACELDPDKAAALIHNAHALGIGNLSVVNQDSTLFLKESSGIFDIIFIDPARRGADNSRVYGFHDCQPDICTIQDDMLARCRRLLIKGSPLLDISQTLSDIHNVRSIRVVSVMGECKEVLVEAMGKHSSTSANSQDSVSAEAIDLSKNGDVRFWLSYSIGEDARPVDYCVEDDIAEGNYIYEPGAAVMKLAPWSELSARFPGLRKLSHSSHLFVSSSRHASFPGRVTRIKQIIDKKSRKTLKGFPANIVSRNYPVGAEQLRRQLGVKEGSDTFLYATRVASRPIIFLSVLATDS